MLLGRKQLLAQNEDGDHFFSQFFGVFESFWVHQHLCNKLVVWHTHSDWPEQLLKIVRQLGPSPVAFAGRVESDKDAGIAVDFNVLAEQFQVWRLFLDGPLNYLNLLTDSGELFFQESIELVEATPGSALDKTNENSAHTFKVDTFIAIEDQHLSPKCLA